MKKKFPELVKTHYTPADKNYLENEKISKMKTKISKMFT
jgi:hypothetical protein